jgi:serine/threonine-protein kinase RsbW
VVPILERITAAMDAAGFPARDVFGMRLAVEEAVVNAIKHGNRGDPTKRAHVDFRVSPEATLVRVADEGPGFDPRLVPDPTLPENLEKVSGRGVMLMRAYTTWIRFNAKGTCVTLFKQPTQ